MSKHKPSNLKKITPKVGRRIYNLREHWKSLRKDKDVNNQAANDSKCKDN